MDDDRFTAALGVPSGRGPLYREFGARLGAMIADGAFAPGERLPPERELARLTGLSRVTVRRGVRMLVEAAHLVQRHGSGTYVAAQPPCAAPPVPSFTEEMRRRDLVTRSAWLARRMGAPSPHEAEVLGLAPGEQVARLARVRLANECPLAIERAVLPASVLPDPEMVGQSLYEALAARGFRPARAVQRVQAVNVTPRDGAILGMLTGGAALKVERVGYLASGRAVELTETIYRGDGFDLAMELSGTTAPGGGPSQE
jgi:GntR family transcriptional regulator